MSLNNGVEHKLSISKDSENRVSSIIDKAVAEARKETQFDSFYQKTAEALKAEAENCIPTITRIILRADYRQKEILLQILKYFKGVVLCYSYQNERMAWLSEMILGSRPSRREYAKRLLVQVLLQSPGKTIA